MPRQQKSALLSIIYAVIVFNGISFSRCYLLAGEGPEADKKTPQKPAEDDPGTKTPPPIPLREKLSKRGSLVQYEKQKYSWKIKDINAAKVNMELDSINEFPTLSDVEIFKLHFVTRDHKKRPHTSTGLVMLPSNIRIPLPILSYHHATRFKPADAPSAHPFDPEAFTTSILFASEYAIVAMPDYLGLEKDSKLPQFYLNAEIQSIVAIDFLRATRAFLKKKEVAFTKDLLISGYSQGAHNALALHKYIEQQDVKDFRILGTSVMSGPYGLSDISRAMLNFKKEIKIEPAFLALALLGMHEAYDSFPRFDKILEEEYSSKIPPILKSGDFGEISSLLPKDAKELFNLPNVSLILASDENFTADENVKANPDAPDDVTLSLYEASWFWKALALNDVDNFAPKAPVLMIHSPTDNTVPFMSATMAHSKMSAAGGNIRPLVELEYQWSDHLEAAYPAFIRTAQFFKELVESPK